MGKMTICFAIASVICVALVALFCDTIKLVEAGTFIHVLNYLGLVSSIIFAITFGIATEVCAYLTCKNE